jgi:hypothetical protein
MNHKIRVIKRGDRKEAELDRLQQPSPPPAREIATTIKMWVSEFKQNRRTIDDLTRAAIGTLKSQA